MPPKEAKPRQQAKLVCVSYLPSRCWRADYRIPSWHASGEPDGHEDRYYGNKERELREIAGRMGCKIVKVYKARPCFKCSAFLPSSTAASSKNVSVLA